MGRERIAGASEGTLSLFALFAHTWGLFSFLNALYWVFHRAVFELPPTLWLVGALGVLLAARPRSPRLFFLLIVATCVDSWLQMPAYSNHTVVKNVALLAMLVAAVYTLLRGEGLDSFMARFAPIGRCALLVMYFFGVFHKLNTDYLNPSVSCAVAVWNAMPGPLGEINHPWFQLLTIYGALVIESAILLGLLMKRSRQAAVVAGIAFHALLALSAYGYYPSFSTLTIALHLLYLSPEAAERIVRSHAWLRMQRIAHSGPGLLAVAAWFGLMALLSWVPYVSSLGLVWLIWAGWMAALVCKYGWEGKSEATMGPSTYSRTWGMNLISLLFFVNCAAPYLGLKNAQAINMFANLNLEGGRSNHLVFSSPPSAFGYVSDLAKPLRSTGSVYLGWITEHNLNITYYDLLNQLERTPDAVVTYERGGKTYEGQTAATLESDIKRELHPRWIRNLFLFRPTDLRSPKPCSTTQ